MHSFVVFNCTYDGTSEDPNPLRCVIGTVDDKSRIRSISAVFLRNLPRYGDLVNAFAAVPISTAMKGRQHSAGTKNQLSSRCSHLVYVT